MRQAGVACADRALPAGFDVQHVCATWCSALPASPRSWHDGVDGDRVAHLLFSVRPTSHGDGLRLRCGPARGLSRPASSYCHDLRSAHYSRVLSVGDLSTGGADEHKRDDSLTRPSGPSHGEGRGTDGELGLTLRTVSAALTGVSKSVETAVLRGVEGSVADAVATALSSARA